MTEQQTTRKPRALETRDNQKRQWAPPSTLPEPTPQDGYVFRWVRVATRGEKDANNLSSKMREGFEPVRAEDHPELSMHEVTDPHSKYRGCVESGGLLLCKIPAEFVQQRSAYYQNQTNAVVESIDATLMENNDSRMPMLKPERQTKISFGNGS